MARAEKEGEIIAVTAPYAERDLIGAVPGAVSKGQGLWHTPLTWSACVTMRGVFGEFLEVGPELAAWAWMARRTLVDPAMALRTSMGVPDGDIWGSFIDTVEAGAHLRLNPYQRADVAYLCLVEQALLANPVGLGKTAVAIRTLQTLAMSGARPFPALIVCPNSLKFTVWQRELAKWAPELSVSVVDGTAVARRKRIAERADVTVINWEAVRFHSRLAPYGSIRIPEAEREPKELNDPGYRSVIADEAHRLHDPATKQTRALWAVMHAARFRVALTGTPVADHVGDLWGILHAVRPSWFPSKTRYMSRWAETTLNFFGGMEVVGIRRDNEREFRQVTDCLWRRVPKEAALPHLPPKLPVQYRHTPMTAKQAKLYKEMEKDLLAQLESGMLTGGNQMTQLAWLTQFAAASAKEVEITRDASGHVHQHLVLSAPSCKVDDMMELLEEMGEDSLVVAAVSRQLVEIAAARLADAGIGAALVTGAQSAPARAQSVADFQEGKARVILLTLGAGGEGLTLTRADTILFMQESYRQLENDQAVGRIDRIGAERHSCLKVVKQITPGTVEERKLSLLAGKSRRIEQVLGDREALAQLLGASERKVEG